MPVCGRTLGHARGDGGGVGVGGGGQRAPSQEGLFHIKKTLHTKWQPLEEQQQEEEDEGEEWWWWWWW